MSNKNENLTELVFIVDRSGSMSGLESDTIGGLNAVLEKNRQQEGDVTVSIVLFDNECEVLYDRVPINQVPKLTEKEYFVRGCTALLDAVGGGIKHIDRVQSYMPDGYAAGKVIFVITTDGMENASHKYDYAAVKKSIEAKTEEGWEFLFLGANIDAAAEASRIGIREDRAATYLADSEGTDVMYDAIADATFEMCSAPACAPRMSGKWKAGIEADTKKRGGIFGRR